MKSIIFLLLTTCCLFPFSSTTFTSENPIILPTTTHDDNIVLLPVRDVDGDPLKTGEKYIIQSALIGSGPVYWANIGSTPCPNTVLQHYSSKGNLGHGTAVKFFIPNATIGDEVIVDFDINIMFSIEESSPCANETVWKVGEYQYVVTGGTLGSKSNVFKIQKYGREISEYENVYKLTYCPPHYLCEDVCSIMDNGNLRLAIFPTCAPSSPPFVFVKAKFHQTNLAT